MATVTKGRTFVSGEIVTPTKVNTLVDSATVTNIVNADVSATAAIVDTKLATIATAGKVANSATTATATNTANAIVTRDASGNFNAGAISANVTGNLTGTASAIADGSVSTTAKIANGIVTHEKLSTGGPSWNSDGVTTISQALRVLKQNNSGEGGQIELARSVDNTIAYYIDVLGAGTTDNKLRVVDAPLLSERIVLTQDGNVGIGNSSPTSKLQVSGNIATTGSILKMQGGDFKYITCESPHLAFYKKTGSYHYYFRKSDDGTETGSNMVELMTIQDSGNVGIGTNSPANKLDIQGTGAAIKVAYVPVAGNTTPAAYLFQGAGLASHITNSLTLNTSGTQIATNATGGGHSIDSSGNHSFYTFSGATVGETATTTTRMSIASDGTINTNANPIMNCPTTAKAWVILDGNTAPYTIAANHNVSSVTRVASSNFWVNFTTAFSNTDYSPQISMSNSTTSGLANAIPVLGARNVGRVQVFSILATTGNAPASAADQISVVVFAP